MTTLNHLMIDLETFGNTYNSAIVTIAQYKAESGK